MPAARLFALLALATLLGVAGILEPLAGRLALGLDGLLLVAFAVDLLRSRRAPLAASRSWPELLVLGVPATLTVAVSSPGRRRLVVRLRETLHPDLAAAPGRRELALPPASRQPWEVELRPSRRGDAWAGPLHARVLGPWRLAWSERRLLDGERRRVYPQIRWQGEVGRLLMLAHRRALGRAPQRLQGQGSEPYALREYLPGDPPSKIHWKSTARHGRLVTREDTWEQSSRLVVLLDAARGMASLDGGRSKLDHALAAALALARVAAARGDRVTVAAFSDRLERSVRLHGGRRGIEAAYAALYDLDARLVEPAFDLAARAASELEPRRATVVVLTSVVDLAAAELLREALLQLGRRHRPLLVNLEDPELVALAYGAPANAPGAFAKASALEILLANRSLGTRLRRAGVRVVQPSADRLALESLEAYLALFRGQKAA